MDIEVIIKKTLVFTGLLVATMIMLVLPTVLIQEYIFRNSGFNVGLIGLTISGMILIFFIRKIEDFLITVTDKYLFQKKYDYKELLKTFTSEVLTVLDFDELIRVATDKLASIMKLESCDIVLLHREAALDGNLSITPSKLTIPITFRSETMGSLMLGKKKSDEDFTRDDSDILQPIARSLGIALSNAKLLKELTVAQQEAFEREKMAVVGTLTAGMAHEIRNPITTIKVFSEFIPEKAADKEFREKYRSIALKEVDKIDRIIQTLVDFSSDEVTEATSDINLKGIIDDIIASSRLDKEIDGRIVFTIDIPDNLPKIRACRREIDEIITNLAQNAVHAIEGHGTITFRAYTGSKGVIIEVVDTGCGMTEEISANIFKPFFTTKSKGYGLGLFLVNEFVRRNKGNISVKSEPDKGTMFVISFETMD